MLNKIDRALYRASLLIEREWAPEIAVCAQCRLDGCGHNSYRVGPFLICRCFNCPRVAH